MSLDNPEMLANVLAMLGANDTKVVKQGEKILKPFLKDPSCIVHLFHQLSSNPDVSTRHHAALLLKKRVPIFYPKFDQTHQNELKTQLLNAMVTETNSAIRTAIAGAVAVLTKTIFTNNQSWPEIFNILMQLSQDPNENLRALSFNLLAQLSEHVAKDLKPHTETLAHMFVTGCQDAVSTVAEAAMSATSVYIMQVGNEPEIMLLKNVINPMLTVMQRCLSAGDEDVVTESFEVIQECAALEQPLINDHVEVITPFVLSIIQSKEYEASLKQSAGQTLMNIIEYRPKLLAKKNLVVPILTTLMDMIAKEDSSAAGSLFSFTNPEGVLNEDEDEDFSPEMDVQKLAQTIIDYMAMHIPSKHFVEAALGLCSQGMSSPDANQRKAGCAVLGVIAEGCADRIREDIKMILPSLLAAVKDDAYYVRECACFALGQFSEHCQPDILRYSSTVLPVVFDALDDTRPTVQGTSCYVLEYFCENLQPETLRPYLPPLMNKLALLLQSEVKTTKEMALTAMAATAVAAEIDFLPYTQTICEILGHLMFQTEPTMFSIRGRALECLGHIAIAIGETHFAPYFEKGMQSATQGVTLNDEGLKEHSFVFVANCAKVMGKAFGNYLPTLVPFLQEVVGESELTAFQDDDEEEEEFEDEEGDDDDNFNYRLNIQEGFINSKKAALTALGALAEHTEEAFYPFLNSTMELLLTEEIGAIFSLHDTIRSEALLILQHLLMCCAVANGLPSTMELQQGQLIALPPAVAECAKVVINTYISVINLDEDKLPVTSSCEGLSGVLQNLGVATLQLPSTDSNVKVIQPLMTCLLLLLSEKAPCQTTDYDEEDEDDDHDAVMDSVTDVLGILAKVMGAEFASFFDEFHKHLIRFMKPSRSHADRAMAIGCFAEVIAEIGAASTKYVEILLPVIQTGLSDSMEGVRRNSAYCVGVLVQSTGSALSPHFLQLLQWLHPLCIRPDSQRASDTGGADIDNALAAVARMISVVPTAVPLPQVLPVVLTALPLCDDVSEGPTIYRCLLQLVSSNEPTAISLLNQIVSVFGEVLSGPSKAVTETKGVAVEFFKFLNSSAQFQSVLGAYLGQLQDEELRQGIQNAISGTP